MGGGIQKSDWHTTDTPKCLWNLWCKSLRQHHQTAALLRFGGIPVQTLQLLRQSCINHKEECHERVRNRISQLHDFASTQWQSDSFQGQWQPIAGAQDLTGISSLATFPPQWPLSPRRPGWIGHLHARGAAPAKDGVHPAQLAKVETKLIQRDIMSVFSWILNPLLGTYIYISINPKVVSVVALIPAPKNSLLVSLSTGLGVQWSRFDIWGILMHFMGEGLHLLSNP